MNDGCASAIRHGYWWRFTISRTPHAESLELRRIPNRCAGVLQLTVVVCLNIPEELENCIHPHFSEDDLIGM